MRSMSQRFVILRHSGHGPLHYDWMLEEGDALATWRTADGPEALVVGQAVEATRLPDHRLAYLDYEGPVSGGRGNVERVAAGTYEPVERTTRRWAVQLSDGQGVIVIESDVDAPADCWRLHRGE